MKALPGEPAELDGSPTPWSRAATTLVKGNRTPRATDLRAHQHGAVPDWEDDLREEVRKLIRREVAAGHSAARAKVAIVVGACVELMAIRSEIENKRTVALMRQRAAKNA